MPVKVDAQGLRRRYQLSKNMISDDPAPGPGAGTRVAAAGTLDAGTGVAFAGTPDTETGVTSARTLRHGTGTGVYTSGTPDGRDLKFVGKKTTVTTLNKHFGDCGEKKTPSLMGETSCRTRISVGSHLPQPIGLSRKMGYPLSFAATDKGPERLMTDFLRWLTG